MSEHEHKYESRICEFPECESHYICECGSLSPRAKLQIEQLKYRAERCDDIAKNNPDKQVAVQRQAQLIREHLKIWLGNAFT